MSAGVTGLVLQARKRDLNENLPERIIRVGYTCSKKVGNAVVRNRSKRRLREIGSKLLSTYGIPGWDFPELHGVSSPILIATTILLVILSIILVVIFYLYN